MIASKTLKDMITVTSQRMHKFDEVDVRQG